MGAAEALKDRRIEIWALYYLPTRGDIPEKFLPPIAGKEPSYLLVCRALAAVVPAHAGVAPGVLADGRALGAL